MKVVLAQRIVIATVLLFSLFMASQTTAPSAKEPPKKESTPVATAPHLTEAQRLAIRDVQVKVLQSQRAVEQTPQWAAYQASQQALNEAVAKVYKELGITTDKWQLGESLEFAPVQQPQAPPATPAKDKP
jgi:hypothetical protein